MDSNIKSGGKRGQDVHGCRGPGGLSEAKPARLFTPDLAGFIAKLKGYIEPSVYSSYRSRYKECIRMLNGLEKSLEKRLPESERRWTT